MRNFQKWSERGVFCAFWLGNVLLATAVCNFSTSELPKVFKKWSEREVFCTFWRGNVLLATATSNFSTAQLPKVIWECQSFSILTWNAFRATAACKFSFLLSTATSAPAALTNLLFDWPDAQIIERTQHFATSLTFGAGCIFFSWFSRYCIFSLLTWLVLICFSSTFQLSILSEVYYLNFLRFFYFKKISPPAFITNLFLIYSHLSQHVTTTSLGPEQYKAGQLGCLTTRFHWQKSGPIWRIKNKLIEVYMRFHAFRWRLGSRWFHHVTSILNPFDISWHFGSQPAMQTWLLTKEMLMERCVLFERCELAPSHERDRCLERKGSGRSKCNSMIYIDLSASFKVCVFGPSIQ